MKIRFGSKKGVSLVEEICAAAVLIIAVVALAGGIGAARGTLSRSGTEDEAAAQAQELADTLITVLSSETSKVSGTDVLNDGTADYLPDGDFSDSGTKKQYTYEPVSETDGPSGYKITVRVCYGAGRYCQMTAYAADTGGAFGNAYSE